MNPLFSSNPAFSLIEPLESRIAPAGLLGTKPLLNEAGMQAVVSNSAMLLHAGQGLSTGGTALVGDTVTGSGTYLLYVLKGEALVFTTDFNNNKQVDFNEITGIAAGDGLQLISFTDIHGDIVTNLNPDGTLTDSDNNAGNGRDGRVLLPSRIEMIQMRSLQASDIDPSISSVASHANLYTSHSIYGGIYAGGGFGFADETNATGGLFFGPGSSAEVSSVGPIKVGTAASGQHFSFGSSFGGPVGPAATASGANINSNSAGDIQGTLATFTPLPGHAGANINGVHSLDGTTPFNIATLQAGDGGFGADGGNIANVTITADNFGGYKVIAGNGGRGLSGGAGGGIVNFSDLGSVTSGVLVKGGNGGEGVTGNGGAGGALSFGTMNVAGSFSAITGSGGNGFANGGAGASFVSGVFSTPSSIPDPTGLWMVGTTRNLDPILVNPLYVDPTAVGATTLVETPVGDNPHPVPGMPANFWPSLPSLGTTQVVDFDHDGFGDVVYTTSDPDQVVVLFGDGGGGYNYSKTIFLDAPANAGAVVVGDFNNDGHPDIAVASSSLSYSGISVFLGQYADVTGNGAPAKFTGFSDALQSALPVVVGPLGANTAPLLNEYVPMKTQVLRMVVGDFNGDHINDLAVQVQFQDPLPQPHLVTRVIFVNGDVDERGFGTGYFYSDWGHGQFADVSPVVSPYWGGLETVSTGPMKVSVHNYDFATIYNYNANANSASWHDLLYIKDIEANAIDVYSNLHPSLFGPQMVAFSGLGEVDTNRKLRDAKDENITLEKATLQDFTLADLNGDGAVDIAALTLEPTGFLVISPGKISALGYGGIKTGQNAGISLVAEKPGPGDLTLTKEGKEVAILATDAYATGEFKQLALLRTGDKPNLAVDVIELGADLDSASYLATTFGDLNDAAESHSDSYAFDLNFPLLRPLTGGSTVSYGVLGKYYFSSQNENVFTSVRYADYHFAFTTGGGGNGTLGSGGAAGSLGAGTLKAGAVLGSSAVASDISIAFDFPASFSFMLADGPTPVGMGAALKTSAGGSGFVNGGAGGSIAGVSLEGNWTASLEAGNGGNGFVGTGGAGGDLKANHINPAYGFYAGSGGDGSVGGQGGNIIGNQLASGQYFDATVPFSLTLIAGDGGHGIKKGGSGGSILNFAPSFDFLQSDATFSGYRAQAGNGGSAVAGAGGAGGSILNSGPAGSNNLLTGDIDWQAGHGGDGLTGGAGGSINSFINSPSDPGALPGAISVLAGNGGAGVSGGGGAGGAITNVSISGLGIGKSYLFGAKFNRVIAGAGGASNGAAGGAGGSVTDVKVTAQGGAMVLASGAGAQGLTAGGTGGSIVNALVNSAGNSGADLPVGRVVAIAGEGGDTLASLPFNHINPGSVPTDLDTLKSFGGVNGRGGNGGSIVGFQQPVSKNTIVDLIAGNGGSTVNYGTSQDISGGVGRGGSISGATVTGPDGGALANINGSIGNSDPHAAIKAYNNVSGDYRADITMAQFVDQYLRDRNQIYALFVDDSLGNVGLVAGAAGRVGQIGPDGRPEGASYGVNGSVSNLALNADGKILSMVAGGVDSIAKIQAISGVRIGGGLSGAIGADKDVGPFGSPVIPQAPALGQLDYYNNLGLVVNALPKSGFGLIDGVIFASNTGGLTGARVQS